MNLIFPSQQGWSVVKIRSTVQLEGYLFQQTTAQVEW